MEITVQRFQTVREAMDRAIHIVHGPGSSWDEGALDTSLAHEAADAALVLLVQELAELIDRLQFGGAAAIKAEVAETLAMYDFEKWYE